MIAGIPPAPSAETTMTMPRPSTVLSSLAAAACLLGAIAGPAEAASYRSVTNVAPGHVAWIYRSPDPAAQRIGYLKSGAIRVHTLGCRKLAKGGWCHIERRGTRGWVQDRYLEAGAIMRG